MLEFKGKVKDEYKNVELSAYVWFLKPWGKVKCEPT